jgi:hypothetical protein
MTISENIPQNLVIFVVQKSFVWLLYLVHMYSFEIQFKNI